MHGELAHGGLRAGTASPLPNTQQPGKLFHAQMAAADVAARSLCPLLTRDAGRQQPLPSWTDEGQWETDRCIY